MTPSGIEPATCQFVAQCLKHYATTRPCYVYVLIIFKDSLHAIVLNALFVSVQILHTSVVIILQNFQNFFENHNKHLNPQRRFQMDDITGYLNPRHLKVTKIQHLIFHRKRKEFGVTYIHLFSDQATRSLDNCNYKFV